MGKYDEEAEAAAQQTDTELADDMKELTALNMDLFPNPADKEVMEELIREVNKATAHNELVTACQVIAVKLSKEGLAAFKEGCSLAKKLAI